LAAINIEPRVPGKCQIKLRCHEVGNPIFGKNGRHKTGLLYASVDDIIIASRKLDFILKFKEYFGNRFKSRTWGRYPKALELESLMAERTELSVWIRPKNNLGI
jgi:hypothetical protein